MKISRISWVALLLASTLVLAQTGQKRRTLVINGQAGDAIVYEIDGRSYVDLETLARIANGTISFRADQIVVNFPGAPANQAASAPAPPSGLSDQFMNAAIQALTSVKQWESTIAYGLQNGIPGDGSRLAPLRNRATEDQRLASVAASTNLDQMTLQLLTNNFNNMQKWNDKMVSARKSLDTANYSMSSGGLKDDALYQKISACSQFLGTMIPSGKFQDDYSCH